MPATFNTRAFIKLIFTLVVLTYAATNHAALFDDKEARKKIMEVEAKQQGDQLSNTNALSDIKRSQAAIEKRLVAIEAVVQGQGLADMQNQLEALKQEIADLKGDIEVAAHKLETTQQRQKDLYTDTDTRLRKIESGANSTSTQQNGSSAPVTASANAIPPSEEKDVTAFNEADNLSRAANHKQAFDAFDTFLKEYPTSKLVPDALYGMGYSQFALKNYKSSIATQQKLINAHPESAKVPDAQYNLANSQIQLSQIASAKKTLKDLIAKYPNADITPSAQKRLKTLEAFK